MNSRIVRYMKPVFLGLLMVALFALPVMADSITVSIDGVNVVFADLQPYTKSDRVMVPVRAPMEQMGATVTWDEASQSVTLVKNGVTAVFTVGQTAYTVDGVSKTMDVAPELTNGRVAFPIRYCAEALGALVSWNPENNTVNISTTSDLNPSTTGPKTVNAVAADNGSTKELQVGDTLILTLDSNATTGYTWVIDPAVDATLMTVKDEYIAPVTPPNMVGAPGQQKFTFNALKAGTVELKMVYKQNWEGGQKGQSFTMTINITDSGNPPVKEVTMADSGKTINIKVGERIVVALESNPSTGYGWYLAQEPDASILWNSPVQYEPGPAIPGAPGTDRWVFDGKGKGTVSVELDYTRPGSNEIPPQIFKMTVVVE